LHGDVDVDTILDLARRPLGDDHGILVEERGTPVKVEVNERVNLYVAVELHVVGRCRGPRSRHDHPEALCYKS
jgi:hypothetical protein